MTRGKSICEFLKKIRQQIADVNGITYAPTVCTHKGECAGTCPACESEREYIESQLRRKKDTGNPIKIIGLSAALMSGYSYASDTIPACTIELETLQLITEDLNSNKGNLPKVGQPAQFPGGDTALHKFLLDKLEYSSIALDNNIMGRVIVSFCINEDGSVSNVKIERGVDPSLDNEVIRVIKIMPKWKSATYKSQPISSLYYLSVLFEYDPDFRLKREVLDGTGSAVYIKEPSTETDQKAKKRRKKR